VTVALLCALNTAFGIRAKTEVAAIELDAGEPVAVH
jgi:hypothetical protein